MKQVIAALILMFLVGALFGTDAFTEEVEEVIQDFKVKTIERGNKLYQSTNFELRTLIELKYKNKENRFGLSDYDTQEGNVWGGERAFTKLLKVYRTDTEITTEINSKEITKHRYFIYVAFDDKDHAVYEVHDTKNFQKVLSDAINAGERVSVIQKVIYEEQLEQIMEYISDPLLRKIVVDLLKPNDGLTTDEDAPTDDQGQPKIKKLEHQFKLMLFIAIVCFAALLVVLVMYLRLKRDKSNEVDASESDRLGDGIRKELREEYEKRLNKMLQYKNDIVVLNDTVNKQKRELVEKQGLLTQQGEKLEYYDKHFRSSQDELDQLRNAEKEYKQVKQELTLLLRDPEEDVSAVDVIRQLASDLNEAVAARNKNQQDIDELKDKLGEVNTIKEMYSLRDISIKDFISMNKSKLIEIEQENQSMKRSLKEIIDSLISPNNQPSPSSELVSEKFDRIKSFIALTGLRVYKDFTTFLLGILSSSEYHELKKNSFRYENVSLFECYFDAETRRDVNDCLKLILEMPEIEIEVFFEENAQPLSRIYDRFYRYYSFLIGVEKCAAKDALQSSYHFDIELFRQLHSSLEKFNRTVGIAVEIAVPFVENADDLDKEFSFAPGATITHTQNIINIFNDNRIVMKKNMILENVNPIIKSKYNGFQRKQMSIYCHKQT